MYIDKCSICGGEFILRPSIIQNDKTGEEKTIRTYRCNQCDSGKYDPEQYITYKMKKQPPRKVK